MAKLKFSENVFLGKQELQRLKQFLDDDGFREYLLRNSVEFGLVDNYDKDSNTTEFPNGRIQTGTSAGTIKNNVAFAINSNGQFLVRNAKDNIAITDDNNWRWVKLRYTTSPKEQGTVTIGNDGSLTGTGTEFTQILRGQPNFPSKIRFLNSQNNNDLEYEVLEVIDNENAILQGNFNAESDLEFAVVGTFTPDSNPPSADKNIFQYDSAILDILQETSNNTEPQPNEGISIPLARVKNDGGDVVVQDKRTQIYKSQANYFLQNLDELANPLIGVESIKHESSPSPKTKNLVQFAWGFRSSNYSINSSLNQITISGGQGGKFKDTSDFSANDFNGWRVYASNGNFAYVKSSFLDASQINLVLDRLIIDDFSNDGGQTFTGDEIKVVPNIDEIEVEFLPQDGFENLYTQRYTYPVYDAIASIPVYIYNQDTSQYEVKYRNKKGAYYSPKFTIPDDDPGYYDESSFDNKGSLNTDSVDRNRKTISNGIIELDADPANHDTRINSVATGDLLAIRTRQFNNAQPNINLRIGDDEFYQIIDGNDLTLQNDFYINLISQDATEANQFILDFRNSWTFNNNTIQIVQDYSGQGDAIRAQATYQIGVDPSSGDVYKIEVDKQDGNGWIEIATYTAGDGGDALDSSVVANSLSNYIDNNRDDFEASAEGDTVLVNAVPTSNVEDIENNWEIRPGPNTTGSDVTTENFSGSNIIISFAQKQLDAAQRHSLLYFCRFTNDEWFVKEVISNKSEFDSLVVNESITIDGDWRIQRNQTGGDAFNSLDIKDLVNGNVVSLRNDGNVVVNGAIESSGIESTGNIESTGGDVIDQNGTSIADLESSKVSKPNDSVRNLDLDTLFKETISGNDFVTLDVDDPKVNYIRFWDSSGGNDVYIANINPTFTIWNGYKLYLFTNQDSDGGTSYGNKVGTAHKRDTTVSYSGGLNLEKPDSTNTNIGIIQDGSTTIHDNAIVFDGISAAGINLMIELVYLDGTWFVSQANNIGVS